MSNQNQSPSKQPGARTWIGVLAVLMLAILAACTPSAPIASTPSPVPTNTKDPSTTEEVKGIQSGQSDSTLVVPTATQSDGEATETPAETEEMVEPTSPPGRAYSPSSRTALEASDPGSFQLASGDLQFVEFFAFW